MLDKDVEEVVYENGHVAGVKSQGEIARCDCVIGDPTYFKEKIKKVGQVSFICLRKLPPPPQGDRICTSHPVQVTPWDRVCTTSWA